MIPAKTLATPYVMDPLMDTGSHGSEGVANLMDFREAIKLGGTVLVGYTFLYTESLSPPVCLMSLRMLTS